MRLFNKVAIIGVGLIGGSLALAIKKGRLANRIVGVSRHKKTLFLAKKNRIIDQGSQSLDIVRDADLVILAAPVDKIIGIGCRISKIIGKDCVVMDVGSTKERIVYKLDKVIPNYVGAHPLAGSEKKGAINADAAIFRKSLCIITPTRKTNKKTLAKIAGLWKRLGSRVVYLNADSHDRVLSFVSHLPHVVAFSLIRAIPQGYLKFSSSGLRDTTRIAASDSEVWADILLANRKNITKTINLFEEGLIRIRRALDKKDKKLLKDILKKAKKKRDYLNGIS